MSDKIPFNICLEILVRLPSACLLRFRAVCKRWRTVIDDPCFVKSHTNNQLISSSNTSNIIIRNSTGPPFHPFYYLDLESLDFTNDAPQTIDVTPLRLSRSGLSRLPALPVAGCNGLILIAPLDSESCRDPKGRTWEIWNPITRERLKLPQPNICYNWDGDAAVIGLGYDCAADDYKVVIGCCCKEKYLSLTHVYSLKLDSWRNINIGKEPRFQYGRRFGKSPKIQHGVFLKGALHWLSDDEIIVFDVGTESYLQLALPSFSLPPESIMHLDALSGCLFLSYYVEFVHRFWTSFFVVWVMNDYGVKESWLKLFQIPAHDFNPSTYFLGSLRPVAYFDDKNGVLLQNRYEFIWFDTRSNSKKDVFIHGLCGVSEYNYYAQMCIGSLFRLHDSCGRRVAAASKIQTTRTRRRDIHVVHTKLTFCLREKGQKSSRPHDRCYSSLFDQYNNSGMKQASSFILDVDSRTTHSVPLDICREIFLYLPAKSLIRFRAACEAWKTIIDEPGFVRAHTNKQLSSNTTNIIIRNSTGPPFSPLYSFHLDDLEFTNGLQEIDVAPLNFTPSGLSLLPDMPVAACDGLMIVADNNYNNLEIWNPLTHECLELPQMEFINNSDSIERVAIGIGYDHIADDYKAVVITYHGGGEERVYRTHVYSLRTDSWITTPENIPCGSKYWCPRGPGVFLCGALHWESNQSNKNVETIIAFDLGPEKYRQLQAPPMDRWYTDMEMERRYLNVLGGCLTVSHFGRAASIWGGLQDYDVWVKKDYGAGDSWINLLSFEDDECKLYDFAEKLIPVAYFKDKTKILLQCYFRFYIFDVESEAIKSVRIHGLTGTLYAQNIPESIFRLHDNCGISAGRRRIRRITKRVCDMKMSNTKLNFCVRSAKSRKSWGPHDSCYKSDSNFYNSSSEDEGCSLDMRCVSSSEEEEEEDSN